ncbi:MAG TPA: MetQ/NlpA family ABC transporter substrate-binding protein [Candidatus Spyradocola merdavium]|nr:MetQ/NlpA family ABC transporter substrate-binding protein [Candidatus Spyradocola merdavium]
MKKTLAALLALCLALCLSACAAPQEDTTLVVGASPAPHAEILEFVKPMLAEQGIDLQIEEFTDYVLPNQALESGDLDANYFQHLPYLLNYNESTGATLVSAGSIHFEPLGIYAGKSQDLSSIPDGAVIAVPNDATNEARALQLLAAQGLITLPEGAGLNVTARDVVDNPHNIEFLEIAAEQVPRTLQDVDFAVANGNYAVEAGILDKVLVTEDASSEGAQTYPNVIAVREGDEDREDIQALVAALKSEETRAFIEETYGASVVPVE